MANPEHIKILQQGIEAWNQWREENQDIQPDLSLANLRDAKLEGADLSLTKLGGADLMGADLRGADLKGADLRSAKLKEADLRGARLWSAKLINAGLICAKLEGADLPYAKLMGAVLWSADLSRAKLQHADLRSALLKGTNLEKADVSYVRYNRDGEFRGIRLGGCHGSERFKRHALHQAFIEELQSSSRWNKFMVGLWSILADCGRTPWRWIGWSMAFCLYYAWAFLRLGPGSFNFNSDVELPFNFGTTLYYSIVTFTTLGFGDITPACGLAAFYVTLEVITGYVMLGGLISFLFSKLLPRG